MATRVLDARTVAALAAMLLLAATSFAVGRSTALPVDTGPGFDVSSPEAIARSFEANVAAAGGAFIKLGDIKGESASTTHPGWSDLQSFSHPISRPSGSNTGSARQRGDVIPHDLTCVKPLDTATPKLAESVVDGAVLASAVIELVRDVGGQEAPFLRYELKQVRVTSHQLSGSVDSVPTESLSLAFSELRMVYTAYGADGTASGKVEHTWKVEEGEV